MSEYTQEQIDKMKELYEAVNAYCEKSQEAKTPIREVHWNRVLIAWHEAKKEIEK